jgi:hypothetical protein
MCVRAIVVCTQGHVYKTWRRRFFILNDTKRLLFYYDDAKVLSASLVLHPWPTQPFAGRGRKQNKRGGSMI